MVGVGPCEPNIELFALFEEVNWSLFGVLARFCCSANTLRLLVLECSEVTISRPDPASLL